MEFNKKEQRCRGWTHGFFLTLFVSMVAFGGARSQSTVELIWDEVPGATLYELEVQTLSGQRIKALKQQTPKFHFPMDLGDYMVRIRAADERKVFGEWSDLTAFKVSVQSPDIRQPRALSLKPNKKTLQASVKLTWEPSPGADRYRVEIFDEQGKLIQSQSLKGLGAMVSLSPGVYSYHVVAVTKAGEESVPPKEKNFIAIDRPQLSPPEFLDGKEIRWKLSDEIPVAGVLEYQALMGQGWSAHSELEFSGKEREFKSFEGLRPGKYRITLWTKAKGWVDSESRAREFLIKPKESALPRGSF